MIRRFSFAAAALILACGRSGAPAFAGQTSLADAQHDYNSGRYNRAVDALNSAIAKSPNDASLQFLLGESYYQLREFPRAVASLERSVQLAPKDSEYHDWLGKAYGRKAEESLFLSAMSWARKTHREFEIAVELDPQNFEAQRDLIRYEINAPSVVGGGDEKALKHIDELEKINPIQGQLARGEFLATKKRMPEADGVFETILESHADRVGVYFEVSDYYRDRVNAEKMGEAVEKAALIDPDDRRLKFYNGVLLVMKGKNPSEAETLLKSYLSTVPDNSDLPPHAAAREWLGKLYESLGRFSEAAEEYRLSLILDPHDKGVAEDLKRVQRK
ncbi:MAG TPA: tetratricopeptide repeat protein [Candidatus Acidoferrales bacterium]|jgi:tetratricopeptide (TPR) repeat protein|nr:tetratricopeptide repeat protein [Candidatus Acidoferrales bacterium]